MTTTLGRETLDALARFVLTTTGLEFKPDRYDDLEARAVSAAEDFGVTDVATLVEWLLSPAPTPDQRDRWNGRLTVGETYFLREPETFAALESRLLPALIERRKNTRRLRFWCAGCSTGEEPYSLAVSLSRTVRDLSEWDVNIFATDLNVQSLKKAEAGVYRDWSFRNTPPWFRNQYFQERKEGWEIRSDLRNLVSFFPLNLTEEFLGPQEPLADLDLIFCRNVLMYFSAEAADSVVGRLAKALGSQGWLLVSANELSLQGLAALTSVPVGGCFAHRKTPLTPPTPPSTAAVPPMVTREQEPPMPRQRASESAPASPKDVRRLADAGLWDDALSVCRQLRDQNPLDPTIHYLEGVICLEAGRPDPAIAAFQKTLYLDPSQLMAYFSLGHLLRERGRPVAARKAFENALTAARPGRPEEILPESDGLTVGRFQDMVRHALRTGGNP